MSCLLFGGVATCPNTSALCAVQRTQHDVAGNIVGALHHKV